MCHNPARVASHARHHVLLNSKKVRASKAFAQHVKHAAITLDQKAVTQRGILNFNV